MVTFMKAIYYDMAIGSALLKEGIDKILLYERRSNY